MSRFEVVDKALDGVCLLQKKPIKDDRGYFERLFCIEEIKKITPYESINQVNYSTSLKKGTTRGLHFQNPPFAEVKVISCIKGAIFDVAVDLRHGSRTFLHFYSTILSEVNHRSLVIPEGFAHGFQSLEDNTSLIYFHSKNYVPNAELGYNVNDPKIGINWPLEPEYLSDRDKRLPVVTRQFQGIQV